MISFFFLRIMNIRRLCYSYAWWLNNIRERGRQRRRPSISGTQNLMKFKEIRRTSTFAWSPAASLPLLATGTVAGALDESFSNESQLEIWAPDFFDDDEFQLGADPAKGLVTDTSRYEILIVVINYWHIIMDLGSIAWPGVMSTPHDLAVSRERWAGIVGSFKNSCWWRVCSSPSTLAPSPTRTQVWFLDPPQHNTYWSSTWPRFQSNPD